MESRVYGYARVSDKSQNETRLVEELLAFGIERRNIKVDKQSGKDFNRKAYLSLVGTEETEPALRPGDLLVTSSIDRFGRNYTEIVEQWRYITQVLGADIKVLDMPLLDTRQTQETLDNRFIADLVLQILSYVAQKERESINRRIRHGIDVMPVIDGKRVSTKTGNATGRPVTAYPENWGEVYRQWRVKEITAVQAMALLNLKKNTFYSLVNRQEAVE